MKDEELVKTQNPFKIRIDSGWLKDSGNHNLYIYARYKLNKLVYWLGCNPIYKLKVLSEPEEVSDESEVGENGFIYRVAIKEKIYRIFTIPIYTKHYEI